MAHPQGFDSVGEQVGQGLRASSGLEMNNAIKAMGKTGVCDSHARHLSKAKVRLFLQLMPGIQSTWTENFSCGFGQDKQCFGTVKH